MRAIRYIARTRTYLVVLPTDRGGMTGREYIKKKMETVTKGWPMDHIGITDFGTVAPNWFDVSFSKAVSEYEIMFKLLVA